MQRQKRAWCLLLGGGKHYSSNRLRALMLMLVQLSLMKVIR